MTQHNPNQVMSALRAAKIGICRSDLLAIATNEWDLSHAHKLLLDIRNYFTKQWMGSYLRAQIAEGCIVDIQSNQSYAVIYRNCTPSEAFRAYQVTLSFRSTNVGCFVLIQPLYRTSQET